MVDELDPDLYCDYYMYFTEVYLAAKMRGYVDQIVVLIDAEGISSANFDFSITKRNLNDLLRLCPERQFKMIGVHVGHFGYLCWNFIKPILPKRTQEKIVVASDDPREMYATLLEEMPKHVIPTYLGGKNTHC